MHDQAIDFVRRTVQLYGYDAVQVSVLDIGGAKVSTDRFYRGPQPRDLFPNALEYLVMDIRPAPDVDIVMDATKPEDISPRWPINDYFEVVLCTEVLEHVKEWPKVLETAYKVLAPDGHLILTCAGPGRPPHAASSELSKPEDEFYANVSHMAVRNELERIGFHDILTSQVGQDTQAVARK